MSPPQQVIQPAEVVLEKYGASLVNKTVLITGVSEDSIAGELAVQISSAKPALLILTARTESRIAPIVEKIRASNSDVKTRFLQMDLSLFSSVRTAAESLQDIPKIDHFAAVAGLMMPPYKKTEDNLESQFQVNYLSNFLLVKLLWPKILAAAPFSSVVILSSSAVRSGGVNFDDTGFSDGTKYDSMAAYSQSNAARVMFAKALAEKASSQKVRVYSIDPGVRTGLQRNFGDEFSAAVQAMKDSDQTLYDVDGKPYKLPPWTSRSEGAATIVTAMIDPRIEKSNGSYLHNNAIADEELHSHVLNRDNWHKLWELSEKLIGESFTF